MGDVAKIAAGLTAKQRATVTGWPPSQEWFVLPEADRHTAYQIVTRTLRPDIIAQLGHVGVVTDQGRIDTRFRWSKLGLAVRAHLLAPPTDEQIEGRG